MTKQCRQSNVNNDGGDSYGGDSNDDGKSEGNGNGDSNSDGNGNGDGDGDDAAATANGGNVDDNDSGIQGQQLDDSNRTMTMGH